MRRLSLVTDTADCTYCFGIDMLVQVTNKSSTCLRTKAAGHQWLQMKGETVVETPDATFSDSQWLQMKGETVVETPDATFSDS
jgi:hypothetical protein